jgi:hypothetical protein
MVIDDAVHHFAHEERLFKEWQYADSQSHAAIHAQIIKELPSNLSNSVYAHTGVQWIETGLKFKGVPINHTQDKSFGTGIYAAAYRRPS